MNYNWSTLFTPLVYLLVLTNFGLFYVSNTITRNNLSASYELMRVQQRERWINSKHLQYNKYNTNKDQNNQPSHSKDRLPWTTFIFLVLF